MIYMMKMSLQFLKPKDLNITRNLIKYYGDDTPFTAKVDAGDAVIFEIME